MKIANTYIDIDTVLNCTVSILKKFGIDITDIYYSDRYSDRVINKFYDVSYLEFKYMWEYRDKDDIKNGKLTKLLDNIRINRLNDIKHNVDVDNSKLYVNYYPYNLNEQEIEKFKVAISNLSGYSIVMISKIDLDRDTIEDNNISRIYKLDGLEWIERYIYRYGINNNLPDVLLMTPSLFNKEKKELRINDFEIIREELLPIINIQFLDNKLFD